MDSSVTRLELNCAGQLEHLCLYCTLCRSRSLPYSTPLNVFNTIFCIETLGNEYGSQKIWEAFPRIMVGEVSLTRKPIAKWPGSSSAVRYGSSETQFAAPSLWNGKRCRPSSVSGSPYRIPRSTKRQPQRDWASRVKRSLTHSFHETALIAGFPGVWRAELWSQTLSASIKVVWQEKRGWQGLAELSQKLVIGTRLCEKRKEGRAGELPTPQGAESGADLCNASSHTADSKVWVFERPNLFIYWIGNWAGLLGAPTWPVAGVENRPSVTTYEASIILAYFLSFPIY